MIFIGYPSVYPTGVTIYKPEKCWNGYNLVSTINKGALLFDMNGNEIRRWGKFHGFPNKLLPGGYLIGYSGDRDPKFGMQDGVDLVQIDYDENIVWKFNKFEYIEDEGNEPQWMARAHHDYQREGNPVGYYVPGMEPKVMGGNTLILAHTNLYNHKISDKRLHDDVFYEVDWEGNILWQWKVSDHFGELGFDEQAKNVLARDPNLRNADGGVGDWLHVNCMSYLGSNKWYDQGDERFKPDNIIWDSRETNIMAIIDKESGKIVWKLGPNWDEERTKHIGYIIGLHHTHMIPKGLPGEGNILVFDNGGWAGYGAPNPSSKIGQKNALRDYSRVLEINPVTLEIVWEWISPYYVESPKSGRNNMICRGYRYPYEWVPQEEKSKEIPIEPIDVTTFRMPNAGTLGAKTVVKVKGTLPYSESDALCVARADESTDNVNREKVFDINTEIFKPLNQHNFAAEVLESSKATLVLFGAERCVHCKTLHPVLEEVISEEFKDQLNVCYVDVDENPELTEKYKVIGIPITTIFKDGKEVGRIQDEKDYDDLADFIESII